MQVRRITTENATTKRLIESDIEASKVMELMRSMSGKERTVKDIHYIRAKSGQQASEECNILDEIQEILTKDQGASVRLLLNESDELEVIFIQTTTMKTMASNFPEVLLMDNTYRINNRKMPLSTIMVIDGNGRGQIAGQAIIANERKETLDYFIANI